MDQLNVKLTWPPVPGLKRHAGTYIIELIYHKDKLKYRMATYARAVRNIRNQKTENHRTRIITGGNIIDYLVEVVTPTSDLTTMKLNVNSSISDVKARYLCMELK